MFLRCFATIDSSVSRKVQSNSIGICLMLCYCSIWEKASKYKIRGKLFLKCYILQRKEVVSANLKDADRLRKEVMSSMREGAFSSTRLAK